LKKLFTLAFLLPIFTFCTAQNYTMLVGSYNTDTSSGITSFAFNGTTGAFKKLANLPLNNASYLSVNNNYVYAVLENQDTNGTGGDVAVAKLHKNGALQLLQTTSTQGNHPCHIAIQKNTLAIANYSTGNASVYQLVADTLQHQQTLQHSGSGPDTTRQKSPHAHHVLFNNNQLYITDLGADKIFAYNQTYNGYVPNTTLTINATPGTGPRHIVLHPNKKYLYALNELTGSITQYHFKAGTWQTLNTINAQPSTYTGKPSGAAIVLSNNGKFLYSSNRGTSNTISIFSVNQKTGTLTNIGFTPTLGLKPRNFNLTPNGKFLLVAHQDSNDITIFARNTTTGLLTATGNKINIGKPVCIVFTK
jgi:6-phosphogluconolactonase